jgi:hypothetical protein
MRTLVECCFDAITADDNMVQLNSEAIKQLPPEVLQRLLEVFVSDIETSLYLCVVFIRSLGLTSVRIAFVCLCTHSMPHIIILKHTFFLSLCTPV